MELANRRNSVLRPRLSFTKDSKGWTSKLLRDFESGENKILKAGPFGSSLKKEDYMEKGYKIYGQEQVISGDPFFGDYFISREKFESLKSCSVEPGDLLMSLVGTFGKILLIPNNAAKGIINPRLIKISIPKDQIDPRFLKQYLETQKITNLLSRRSQGGTMGILNIEIIGTTPIIFPSLLEQQKIASFFSAVDEKIQQLTRKKELLEQYKKGVMQQLFSGKLRFKDENGKAYPKWEKKMLADIAERVVRRNKENNLNVLTISAQSGLVSQLEYFNKSVAAKDVTNYYLLERNEFAYNKSYSSGYPMGAIKRLVRYDKGVVSTLYICFRFGKNVALEFMEQYFENGKQNMEIEKVAQEGARNHGLLNIGVNDFFNIELTLPSFAEQQKIARFLSALDTKIESVTTQITHTQTFKKGLLQQMFV
jgi:type I restriction enzyme, S subunit